MIKDRPMIGMALMLGFCIVAPMADAATKLLGEQVPVGQMLFWRFAIQVAVLVPLIAATGRPWRMRGRVLRLTLLRTVLHLIGIGMMFRALQLLPLADAVAITFVMPFLMLLLGRFVLGEEVGPRRLAACCVGFVGTLLVIQPSFASVGPAALLPLGVAVNFAFFMLLTRQIAKDTDPVGLQAVSGSMAVMILLPLLALGAAADLPALSTPALDGRNTALLLAVGLLGTLAHLMMTWSLRFAPSATLAPMQYLEIPIACLIGWLIFAHWPDTLASLGISITIAAGLYIVLRERAIARPVPAP